MRKLSLPLFLFVAILLAAQSAFSEGFIFTTHPDTGVVQPLVTKTLKVTFEATESIAKTTVEQTFYNPTNRTLEGRLVFPLPRGAAVSSFAMWVGNTKLMARVLPKKDANNIYNDIVRKMRDPALLQYLGRGMFEARVYPIAPRSTKKIELQYSCVLDTEADVVDYVFPLNSFTVTHLPVMSFVLVGRIKSRNPLKNIYCASHDVAINRLSDTEASVSFECNDLKAERDFRLFYTLSRDEVGINLLSQKDGADGYFLLLASPNYALNKRRRPAKEVVFALDISGSMQGKKIEQARKAAKHIVSNLGKQDYFNLVVFNDQVRKFANAQVRATKSEVRDAMKFIDGLEAAGGTNIDRALRESLQMLHRDDMPRMVIFLTDGQPTVGVTDLQKILDSVKAKGRGAARVYCFGVGYDVGADLLDGIARVSHGTVSYVLKDDDLERVISSFYNKVSYPVLSDVRLDIAGVKTFDMYPSTLPDLFRGTQVVLFGKYAAGGPGKVTLSGRVEGETKKFRKQVNFAREPGQYDFIPRLWALRRVGFMLDEIRQKGEVSELVDECVRLGTKYAIVTPYTSHLVTDEGEGTRPRPVWWATQRGGILPMRRTRPADGTKLPKQAYVQAAGAATRATLDEKGKIASSMVIQELSMATAEKPQYTGQRRLAGRKVFVFRNGCWTDTAIEDLKLATPDRVVECFGDAYFKMVREDEELAKYFSVGKCLIVLHKGKVIKVTAPAS